MAEDPSTLDLALIGNCCISALIDRRGRIVWSCFPRFDGDPVFHALLGGPTDEAGDGAFEIELIDAVDSSQSYVGNTAVVRTVRPDRSGRFSVEGLPPARYLALALPSSGMGDETHPDRLEQLRPLGTRVTVEQGAPRTVSLRTTLAP